MKAPKAPNTPKAPKTPKALKWSRISLGLAGAGIAVYGLLGLPTQLGIPQLVGLVTWMAVAVLLHDGVIVPLSTLAGAGLTRLSFGLRPASAAVLRGALMTGAVTTLVVGVVIKAQSVARNTSVLESDYAANLAWFWAVLAVAAGTAIYTVERAGKGTDSGSQPDGTVRAQRPPGNSKAVGSGSGAAP
ncbi:hypothetical protein [Pseudarthrobacter sp. N5]|uniref:hypothetical protein n=1 Tax=Pseudarthrobacter sp. N5 TaxID=3418416 RepID=UPI003CEBD471